MDAGELFKAGMYLDANNLYNLCLEIFPANNEFTSIIYLNRSASYWKLKKLDKALIDLYEAIKHNEKCGKAYVKWAEINIELRKFGDAVSDLEKAKQIDSKSFDVEAKLR